MARIILKLVQSVENGRFITTVNGEAKLHTVRTMSERKMSERKREKMRGTMNKVAGIERDQLVEASVQK